jgi:hypothetical protein
MVKLSRESNALGLLISYKFLCSKVSSFHPIFEISTVLSPLLMSSIMHMENIYSQTIHILNRSFL